MEFIPAQIINDFFENLNKSNIDYVLLRNMSDELPNSLENGKDIDILVKENQIANFQHFMKTHNFRKSTYPYGKARGWCMTYKLPEPQTWLLKNTKYIFKIDATFKMKCRSITPKVLIPLDNCINEDVWKNKLFDEKKNWWILDDETTLIHILSRAIFDKKEFKPDYISEIEKRKALLKNDSVRYKLSKVFFKYTDLLISQVENGSYENIVNNYLTFKEY